MTQCSNERTVELEWFNFILNKILMPLTVFCLDFKKTCIKQASSNQDFYQGLECLQGIS